MERGLWFRTIARWQCRAISCLLVYSLMLYIAMLNDVLYLVRPLLVYCLFPVPMFSKNWGGQEVIVNYYIIMLINHCKVCLYKAKYFFSNAFTITVMLKDSKKELPVHVKFDWIINFDRFWCCPLKLMRTVTGNNYYTNDIALYSYLYSYLILIMIAAYLNWAS